MSNRFTAKIYTLSDSEGEVFYVGVTLKSIEERVSAHLSQANQNYPQNDKTQLIRKLQYKITASIIDTMEVEGTTTKQALIKARPLEQKWIEHYRSKGCSLCNYASMVKKSVTIIDTTALATVNHSIY